MQVLRAADRIATPWKNGGGVTREVVAWPPGAGFDDFHWRVSMAEVRADGPFSLFPGVDRILAVLQGALALDIEGRGSLELNPDAPPAVFPGDAPTVGRLLDGAVEDLNIMARRGIVHATLERVRIQASVALPRVPGMQVLVARTPVRAQNVDLAVDDALLLEQTEEVILDAPLGAEAYLAVFRT